ncbi:cyclin [Penicillium malachiteum]|nr:cyclin [Penicillium malachiteum]
MECAGRALGFWAYQSTQEMYLDLQASQEELKKKNQELVDQYREKSKKLSQMTTLYNLLKARTLHSQMETAAADSVTKALKTPTSRSGLKPGAVTPSGSSYAPSIQTISRAPLPRASSSRESVSTISIPRTSFPVDADGVEQLHPYQKSGSAGSAGSTSSTRSNRVSKNLVKDTSMGPPLWPASWTRNRGSSSSSLHHRTRLPRGSSRSNSRGTIRPEVLAAGFGKPFDIEAPK